MATYVDHKNDANSRLIVQYKESETLESYLNAVLDLANDLEKVFCDLQLKRFIDTAEGATLDIIGAIVGQPRVLLDVSILSYFGFSGATNPQPFGTVASPSSGGRFRTLNDPLAGDVELADPEYRKFIRARILKNNSTATREAIIFAVEFLFENVERVQISEGDRAYTVLVVGALSFNDQALLKNTSLIPKPQGIRSSFAVATSSQAFAFSTLAGGAPENSAGFGTVADPLTGGTLATLL